MPEVFYLDQVFIFISIVVWMSAFLGAILNKFQTNYVMLILVQIGFIINVLILIIKVIMLHVLYNLTVLPLDYLGLLFNLFLRSLYCMFT
jgi:hypothetical protein